MDADLLALIYRYAYNDGNLVSPPCVATKPFTVGGVTTTFPQIRRDPPGG